ncbi:MarR family winged helix-turn-helix transcriptional regulator [Rhodoferax aquaticus]|uniref:MarR family transcriptional regulator n=1 Tax=Rhodoferax aquaticus TaxID=2527691 RepID=A0A515EJU4_9BURK|nr:MarR family winged helix-turn-helix transcriptional regulator [Rhodoferax aquaticus]QDL52869.1 MarR family transcriptional regulator [Rhodoferax aquaticus]
MPTSSPNPTFQDAHVGHWLRLALARFDARVSQLMAQHPGVSLGLSNLVARDQLGAAHIHITRHLNADGARLTDLAQRAGMSKQAMGALVNTCEAWGMVERGPDPSDARARWVQFTATGLAWLGAYRDAVRQAEEEMRQSIGAEVVTVVTIGLEAYSSQ